MSSTTIHSCITACVLFRNSICSWTFGDTKKQAVEGVNFCEGYFNDRSVKVAVLTC